MFVNRCLNNLFMNIFCSWTSCSCQRLNWIIIKAHPQEKVLKHDINYQHIHFNMLLQNIKTNTALDELGIVKVTFPSVWNMHFMIKTRSPTLHNIFGNYLEINVFFSAKTIQNLIWLSECVHFDAKISVFFERNWNQTS